MEKTTISVEKWVADRLYERKGRGQTYNDAVKELLEIAEQVESEVVDEPTVPNNTEPIEPTEPKQGSPVDDDLVEALRSHLEAEKFPKTEHGRSATIDVFVELREHGELKTGNLKEAVYPNYSGEWSSKRSMWETLGRYLEDIPGISKAGYGKWKYDGDEIVRLALEGAR